MLREERRGDHPRTSGHEAFREELALRGVDDGIAGLAFLPSGERLLVLSPGELLPLRAIRDVEHARPMTKDVVGELAPHELVRILRERARRVPHGARGERAEL